MVITITIVFVIVAIFFLILINMYSDYVTRREQDVKLIAARARNTINECEELILNQAQVAYSKTLVLVLHYRIIRALKKCRIDTNPRNLKDINTKIKQEEDNIAKINQGYQESSTFKAPESDTAAIAQLRVIRRLRSILKTELSAGIPLPSDAINKEDKRLYILILKVNISNLIQKIFELKRLKQVGSCRALIAKGLDVIRAASVKDSWLIEKADLLTNLLNGIEAERRAQDNKQSLSSKDDEIDEIFGEKKKW